MWIGSPFSVRFWSVLMKSVLLSKRGIEFGPLRFIVERSLQVKGQGGCGSWLSMVSSTVDLRLKMIGASVFFMPVLSTRFELWESPLVQIVDLSLSSSSLRGANSSGAGRVPRRGGPCFR